MSLGGTWDLVHMFSASIFIHHHSMMLLDSSKSWNLKKSRCHCELQNSSFPSRREKYNIHHTYSPGKFAPQSQHVSSGGRTPGLPLARISFWRRVKRSAGLTASEVKGHPFATVVLAQWYAAMPNRTTMCVVPQRRRYEAICLRDDWKTGSKILKGIERCTNIYIYAYQKALYAYIYTK